MNVFLGTVGARCRSLLLIVVVCSVHWPLHWTSRPRNRSRLPILVSIAVIIALIEVIVGLILVPVALEVRIIVVVEVVLTIVVVVIVRLSPNEGLLGRRGRSRVRFGLAWLSCWFLHLHGLVIFTDHWLGGRLDVWFAYGALPF